MLVSTKAIRFINSATRSYYIRYTLLYHRFIFKIFGNCVSMQLVYFVTLGYNEFKTRTMNLNPIL